MNNVRGKIASVFKLKEIVTGKKKVIQEATVLFDPESNAEVTEVEAIKSLSLNHCKKLLTNRPPKSGYESDLQLKSVLHDDRMRESIPEEEFELSYEMFNAALMRLKVKHASKFSFILKGGKSLICSIFSLCLTVWKTEKIPTLWKKTNIIQIHKGKGRINDINNFRNIHTEVDTR